VPQQPSSASVGQTGPAAEELRSRSWDLRRGLHELWSAEEGTATFGDAVRWVKSRLWGPGSLRLRLIFIGSILALFVLAPLTSWSTDTPSFVGAVVSLLYRGSPYATDQLFNPPLGSFLAAPFFAIASIWVAPQSLVFNVASIAPAASVSGVSTQIPSAIALLALKTPLIMAMGLTGLSILYVAERIVGRDRAIWVAGAWFLNPLAIWATAVHGEADVLACATVLLFLIAALHRWYFAAGVALALGILAKEYPIVLLPMAAVAINFNNRPPHEHSPIAGSLRFFAGLGLTAVPFLVYLPNLVAIDGGLASETFGGFNPLLLFNPGDFLYGPRLDAAFFSQSTANSGHLILTVVFVGAIAGSLLLAYIATFMRTSPPGTGPTKTLLYSLALPAAGVLLYQTSPQSENLLLLLALVLLLACYGGRILRTIYWLLTSAGMLLYLALASPMAFFYPLVVMGGSGWIRAANSVVIRYSTNSVLPPRDLWATAGLVGGACILLVCALAFYHTAKEFVARTLRSMSNPVSGAG
jgi:hypothetical protein